MKKSRFLTAVLAIVLILSLCGVTNASASGLLGLITGEKNSTVTITKADTYDLMGEQEA